MRYSVVLPRIDSADPAEVRAALEKAVSSWEAGEQTAAISSVRLAAQAAKAAGSTVRADTLERAVTALSNAVEQERLSQKPAASGSGAPSARKGLPRPKSGRPQPPVSRSSAMMAAAGPSSRSGKLPAAPSRSGALAVAARAQPTPALAPADEDLVPSDLLVTLTPADGSRAEGSLVGHPALRVAIAPGRGPGGTVMIRPLAPGEIAPKGSAVALLVSLEPGASPIPRAGT